MYFTKEANMTNADDRQAGDEKKEGATIEVTPEMVEAGLEVLAAYDPAWSNGNVIVADVFRSMACLSPQIHSPSGG